MKIDKKTECLSNTTSFTLKPINSILWLIISQQIFIYNVNFVRKYSSNLERTISLHASKHICTLFEIEKLFLGNR